jgi:hypothetical protein
MALIYVGANATPNYVCLSTDVGEETNQVVGAIRKGATVYVISAVDGTGSWKIIKDDLTLGDYTLPVSLNVENVTIDAAIAIDQTTTGSTNAVHILPAGGVGSLTETAPATDTASSGLNGRLQRLAQRITSLITLLPAALGANGGLKVEGVTSGTAVPVSGTVTATANAGTNLNTSALAIETGGNLAEIKTNTDNIPAVGQAAMAASTPVVIANNQSDVPVVSHNLADEIIVTPTLTVAATYISGDYVGTSGTAMTFSNCARANGGTGTIVGAMLIDHSVEAIAGELWLFDAPVTPPADSAPWSLSGADGAKCIGVIPFTTYYSSVSSSHTFVNDLNIVFKTESDSRNLYGCFVTRGTPDYASGSITFKLRVRQD